MVGRDHGKAPPGRRPASGGERLAVLGAGPVGLEAALYALRLGYEVTVYEADRVGGNVLAWGHVGMFSPWKLNVSPLGGRALEALGRRLLDPDACPTGSEFVREYLEPLAESPLLRDRLRCGVRVAAVGRQGRLKGDAVGDPQRAATPFRLLLQVDGREEAALADRVLDATGVYGQHNWLGSGGIPAPGERSAGHLVAYRMEDVAGTARGRYAGKRVLVVGGGYSAATAVTELARLARRAPGTRVTWVVRSRRWPPVAEIPDDPLPLRRRLAEEANRLAAGDSPAIRFLPGREVTCLRAGEDEVELLLQPSAGPPGGAGKGGLEERRGGQAPPGARPPDRLVADRVLALVGYRPDLEICRELQVHTCWATEGPMKLAAALLGEEGGDCLAQQSPGPESLSLPEPHFLWLGHKAYGRNPHFLIRLGLEQIRDAFRLWERDPELDLYAEEPAIRHAVP